METPRHNTSPSLALHKEPEVAVGTTSANGFVPGYKAVTTVDLLMNAPFDE